MKRNMNVKANKIYIFYCDYDAIVRVENTFCNCHAYLDYF